MNPLNPLSDVRNTLIGFVDDVCHFSYHHPFLALGSGGAFSVGYGMYSWGYHLLTYLTSRCSELINRSHRYVTSVLETPQESTVKPLNTWSFNPLHYLPFTWRPGYSFALWTTPLFQGYELKLPDTHSCKGSGILSTSTRPMNLLASATFRGSGIAINTPYHNNLISWLLCKSPLLQFNTSSEKVAQFVKDKAALVPDETVSVCAKNVEGSVNGVSVSSLEEIYGANSCEFSRKEILDISQSQKIYVSRLLPLPFYQALATALENDGYKDLPQIDLRDVRSLYTRLLLRRVARDPTEYGFQGSDHFNKFCKLSLPQIGAMVIKTQKFHPLVDSYGKIVARSPNSPDDLQLIDLSSLKDTQQDHVSDDCKRAMMRESFKTCFAACHNGIALFPAVGLESRHGSPSIYWRAFLDAVQSSRHLPDWIGICPEHPATLAGSHKNATGQEFQPILNEYIREAQKAGDWHALSRLRRITNFHGQRRDLVQLARSLKHTFKNKQVSLINASDPDITLGGRVGGQLNLITRACKKTAENFTAIGTNLFNFTGISQVHSNPSRQFQT